MVAPGTHDSALSLATFERHYRALFDWQTEIATRAHRMRHRLEELCASGLVVQRGGLVRFNAEAVDAAHAAELLEKAAFEEDVANDRRRVADLMQQRMGSALAPFVNAPLDPKALKAEVESTVRAVTGDPNAEVTIVVGSDPRNPHLQIQATLPQAIQRHTYHVEFGPGEAPSDEEIEELLRGEG